MFYPEINSSIRKLGYGLLGRGLRLETITTAQGTLIQTQEGSILAASRRIGYILLRPAVLEAGRAQ